MLTSRRSFFGVAAGAAAIPGVAFVRPHRPRHRPPITTIDAVSMYEGERGYEDTAQAHSERKKIRIYLDGVEQTYCDAADATAGWVRRCALNSKGDMFIGGDHKIVKETIHGLVVIEIEARA